jgi:rhodanese-related sulfurtransferase
MIKTVTATQLAEMLRSDKPPRLLDVREQVEFDIASLPNAILLPLSQIAENVSQLEPLRAEPVVVYCHHGIRSMHAINFLRHSGFENLTNLTGGIDAWSLEVDPNVARY